MRIENHTVPGHDYVGSKREHDPPAGTGVACECRHHNLFRTGDDAFAISLMALMLAHASPPA